MTDIFEKLESNSKDVAEQAKQRLQDQFGLVKDPWLLHGLYDYYLQTNSVRAVELLVNISEPHHNYLLDRLSDSIVKCPKTDVKVQALTLLGHVVRRNPSWLSKFPEHRLFKELLQLLKLEADILPLLSALLVLIVLIPMIPNSMGELLIDIFEIFSRLASWNCNPGRIVEDQMIHMQVALYALFLRLYGMFPCNFLFYLRSHYKDKNRPVFIHTIKPMLETVKMNPSLVTTSKDSEVIRDRWSRMDVHDVIVECERFSLDVSDTCCAHDTCQLTSGFRSRSGTASSTSQEASYFQSFKSMAASMSTSERNGDYFTPSMFFNPQTPPLMASGSVILPAYTPQTEFTHDENVVPQAGSSPPEAAIEATPETTPILHDTEQRPSVLATQQHPSVSRTLSSVSSTPPSSPVRKEKSPFHFSPDNTGISSRVSPQTRLPPLNSSSSSSPLKLLSHSPTSPLKIKSPQELARQSPTRSVDSEILATIEPNTSNNAARMLKQSDSVLHESEDSASDNLDDSQDRNSPCTAGGLHMPDMKSMKDFARRVRVLRHRSQYSESDRHERSERSTGSSPGGNCSYPDNTTTVRRAISCPEMKKSPHSSTKDNVSSTLDETDEEERAESVLSNGNLVTGQAATTKELITSETQTDNIWPMPYEHLFLSIFPALDSNETRTNPGRITLEQQQQQSTNNVVVTDDSNKFGGGQPPSIYEVLDSYVCTASSYNEKDNQKQVKNQLKLVHQQLLFERHRREIHAYKNRSFLRESKNNQVLEEYNSALRDQVQLQQFEIDNLKRQLEKNMIEKKNDTDISVQNITYLENKCKNLESDNKTLKEKSECLTKDLTLKKLENRCLTIQKQKVEDALLNALAEVKIAKEQAQAGEKGRAELEYVNKQLLIMGELQLKYKERLDEVASLRRSDNELQMLKDTFGHEMKAIQLHLQEKITKLEACIRRITELEQIIVDNEDMITRQKRILNNINDENAEKLKAVEQKYQTQLTINRTIEEKCLEMWQQIELSTAKPVRSPDTSSCQEVQVPSDKASGGAIVLSELSSPLSCSLASSEGSSALVQSEIKNLVMFADQESPHRTET